MCHVCVSLKDQLSLCPGVTATQSGLGPVAEPLPLWGTWALLG